MRRPLITWRPRLRRLLETLGLLLHARDPECQLPQFVLDLQRDGVQPLEIVLKMGYGCFQTDQSVGRIVGHDANPGLNSETLLRDINQ